MKPFYLLILVLLVLPVHAVSFRGSASGLYVSAAVPDCVLKSPSDSLAYKIIPGMDQTYGYDIFLKGKLLIHQPSVPCIQGNKGFANKEGARKVAIFVMDKIRKGIMPPTLTVEEMKQLGIVI